MEIHGFFFNEDFMGFYYVLPDFMRNIYIYVFCFFLFNVFFLNVFLFYFIFYGD